MLAEKEKIEEQIKKLKKYPSYGGISDDAIAELSDYQSNLAVDKQIEIVLKKINKALKAIEAGRLKIMPYADLCVTCQNNAKKER